MLPVLFVFLGFSCTTAFSWRSKQTFIINEMAVRNSKEGSRNNGALQGLVKVLWSRIGSSSFCILYNQKPLTVRA